ncbi:ABC transporter permease [Rhodococcus sp. 5G237]
MTDLLERTPPPVPIDEIPESRWNRPLQFLRRNTTLIALSVILFVLVIVPLVMLIVGAFTDAPPRPGEGMGSFQLDNFSALFQERGLRAAQNSLIVSLCAGALALCIGGGLAWLAARTDMPFRGLAQAAGIVPLFISGFVGAMAWSILASPQAGLINLMLSSLGIGVTLNVYSLPGVIFVMSLYYSPYAFVFMYGSMSLMNPELEEAAAIHGAKPWQVVTRVTLPMVRPAILAAGILTFTLIIEDFPIPSILSGGTGNETLASYVYALMSEAPARLGEASAVGFTLILVVALLVTAQRMLVRGKSYQTVTGKGFKPSVMKLGKFRWPAFALVVLYLFLAVVLPMLALLKTAFSKSIYVKSFGDVFDSSKYSTETFVKTIQGTKFILGSTNSLIAGASAAVIGVVLYFVLAHYINRRGGTAGGILQIVAVLPVAVPALVLGIALMWTWAPMQVPVYGTLAILVIAYIVRFMPQGHGGILTSMQQISPELEEAARMSGAGAMRATSYVTFPLLRTSIFSGGLMVFILSLRELSASIFLYTTDTRVLSVVVFEEWENGAWDRVASIGLAYSAVLLVLTLVGRRWMK